MARKKDGIAKLKLTITEDPEGVSYVHLASDDLSMQLTVRDLTVVDLRRPPAPSAGAQVVVGRQPERPAGGDQ